MAKNVIEMVIRLNDKASPSIEQVGGAAEKAGKQAKTSSTKWTELSSKLHLLKVAANVTGKVLSVMFEGGKGAVEVGQQMEGFETRLNVLMGSADAAKKRLDELFVIGSTTPFELSGLVEAEVNLRALGVNAEEALPMIMDFAGAMNVDVARAAVEVGRAMQFGAGAVETIAGRALRAQVELKTGGDALKMSTGEFKAALVDTLMDEQGIFAGGTAKLAATFQGMVSNMKDAFFKFQKEVADAKLFKAAKLILKDILRLLGDTQNETTGLATVIGDQLTTSLLSVAAHFGMILSLMARATRGFGYLQQSAVGFQGMINRINDSWIKMALGVAKAGLAMKQALGLNTDQHEANIAKTEQQRKENFAVYRGIVIQNDALRANEKELDKIVDRFGNARLAVENIRLELARLEKTGTTVTLKRIGKDGKEIRAPDGATPQTDAEKKAAEKAAKDREKAEKASAKEWQDAVDATAATIKAAGDALAERQVLAVKRFGDIASPKSGILDVVGAAGPQGAAAAGIMGALSSMGEKGAKAIKAELKGFIKNIITALVEVLPMILADLPVILVEAIPRLVGGLIKAVPLIIKALVFDLPKQLVHVFGRWLVKAIGGFFRFLIDGMPKAIWQGVKKWFAGAWKTIKAALSDLNPLKKKGGIFTPQKTAGRVRLAAATLGASEVIRGVKGLVKGSKQTGGFISETGLHMLHQGERVMPSTGASTSAMQAAAGNIGGGQNIVINTNVVDPNAMESLGRLLDRQFGQRGRSRAGIFSNAEPLAGLV